MLRWAITNMLETNKRAGNLSKETEGINKKKNRYKERLYIREDYMG